MQPTAVRWLGVIALTLFPQAEIQAQAWAHLSPEQSRNLEAAIRRNPNDDAARSKLLDYYFLDRSIAPKEAIAARRRHILWLIENQPGSELSGSPQSTIDAAGHSLADPEGYKLASAAWRRQTAKPDATPAALAHAAYFFKTADREYSLSLLKRAVSLDPGNKEISARLGDQYALIILGITAVNRSGYPVGADRTLTRSALAGRAREELNTSHNAYVLAKAGYMIAWQGMVVYATAHIPFDPILLARDTAERAVSIAPHEADIAEAREEVRKIEKVAQDAGWPRPAQLQMQGRPNGAPSRETAMAAQPATPAISKAPAPPRTAASAPAKGIDLKQITVGMTREQVLSFGAPSGRITTEDEGHLVEVFEYYVNGTPAGTVRLKDGAVAGVQIR
jgi:hypothetical protein